LLTDDEDRQKPLDLGHIRILMRWLCLFRLAQRFKEEELDGVGNIPRRFYLCIFLPYNSKRKMLSRKSISLPMAIKPQRLFLRAVGNSVYNPSQKLIAG
jgi:hypothetical protein